MVGGYSLVIYSLVIDLPWLHSFYEGFYRLQKARSILRVYLSYNDVAPAWYTLFFSFLKMGLFEKVITKKLKIKIKLEKWSEFFKFEQCSLKLSYQGCINDWFWRKCYEFVSRIEWYNRTRMKGAKKSVHAICPRGSGSCRIWLVPSIMKPKSLRGVIQPKEEPGVNITMIMQLKIVSWKFVGWMMGRSDLKFKTC